MKQDHVFTIDGKEDPRNAAFQCRADFPQVLMDLSNERHSKGPPKLRGLDIFSDPALFLSWKCLQPFPYRLAARLGSIENNVENIMGISHDTPIVPNMVRMSTLLFDEEKNRRISRFLLLERPVGVEEVIDERGRHDADGLVDLRDAERIEGA